MTTPSVNSPSSPPRNWRSVAVSLGLFCAIGGLFMAAGFKDAMWPKALTIGGVLVMIVGGAASAVMSRRDRLARSKADARG